MLTVVMDVFTAVADWFVSVMPTILSIFYADGALTFLGVLAVAGLAVSIVLLVLNIVRGFLHFR